MTWEEDWRKPTKPPAQCPQCDSKAQILIPGGQMYCLDCKNRWHQDED